MRYIKKPIFLLTTLAIFLSTFIFTAFADDEKTIQYIDRCSLEKYVNNIMTEKMDELHAPGVTISIVQRDEVLLCKGYGYQDYEHKILSSGLTSMYSIGSVSKLFVFTSIMQLAEQDMLDLDADIHDYLDFELNLKYNEPITLNHLINHTAGFEDLVYEMTAASPEKLQPMGTWLKTHQPEQILPPGDKSAYSNYGITLAAYIVELVSGMSYDEYISKNIIQPLDMNYTVFDVKSYEDYSDYIANGYIYSHDKYIEKPEEYFNVSAAGAVKSSAENMSHLMIAYLNNGTYNNNQILQPDTLNAMFSPTFTPAPNVSSVANGFWMGNYKGIEYLGHGGNTMRFHSRLILIDELDLGVFISCNQYLAYMLPYSFFEGILDEFYGDLLVENTSPKVEIDLNRFTGSYTSGRNAFTTNAKVTIPLSFVKITKNADGTLSMGEDILVPIDDLIFRNENDSSLVVFTKNSNGKIENLYYENAPAIYYSKDGLWNNSIINLVLLLFCVFVFISTILIWLVRKIIYIIKKKQHKKDFLGLAAINSLAALIPLAAFLYAFVNQSTFTNGQVLYIKIALVLPFVFIAGLVYFIFNIINSWKNTKQIILKIYWIIIITTGIIYVYWMYIFNMIGWHFI